MNIFTNLLFLQGHLADPHLFDEDDDRYSQRVRQSCRLAEVLRPARPRARQARQEATRPEPHLDPNFAACGCG